MHQERENLSVLYQLGHAALASGRIQGRLCGDDVFCQEAGLRDASHFWQIAFSESMEAREFVSLLADLFHTPWHSNDVTLAKIGLSHAVREAYAAGETWVHKNRTCFHYTGDDLKHLIVEPQVAAVWIAAKPKRRHLIETNLSRFLSASDIKASASLSEAAQSTRMLDNLTPPAQQMQDELIRTGPRPAKRQAVEALLDSEPSFIRVSAEAVMKRLSDQGIRVGKTVVSEVQRKLRTTPNSGK